MIHTVGEIYKPYMSTNQIMNCTPKVGHTDQRLEVQFYGKRTFH
ncbi:hypothetical protein, partial [Enterococcus faecalis]